MTRLQVRGRQEAGVVMTALGIILGWSLSGVAFAAGPGQLAGLHGFAARAAGSTHAVPGYLGVDIRDMKDEEAGTFKLKEAQGAVILRVDHDGPAGKCGLHEHDAILQLNGVEIYNQYELRKMLKELPPGRSVSLVIDRDGQQMTISTQMANREEVERQAWQQHLTVPGPATPSSGAAGSADAGNGFMAGTPPNTKNRSFISSLTLSSTYTGASIEVMEPQLAAFFGAQVIEGKVIGVLVHSVDANSPAADAGLRAGDVVMKVNGTEIRSSSLWYKLMRENKGTKVSVAVLRDRKEEILTLIPDSKKHSSLRMMPLTAGREAPDASQPLNASNVPPIMR